MTLSLKAKRSAAHTLCLSKEGARTEQSLGKDATKRNSNGNVIARQPQSIVNDNGKTIHMCGCEANLSR